MNILFVQNDLNPTSGGIARVSNLLSKYFAKKGHDVYFLYFNSDYESIDDAHKCKFLLTNNNRFMYKQIADFVKGISGGVNVVIIQSIFFHSIRYALVRLREEFGFKIIACLHGKPSGLLPKTADTFGVKCKNLLRQMMGRTIKSAMKKMCMSADEFVLLSSSFREEMTHVYGINDIDRMKAIPNPLTFDVFANEKQIMAKEKLVLIISRLYEQDKNLKAALRIWKIIEQSGQCKDWRLVLAGHGGDEQLILDYANSLQLDRFEFIGRTENPLELYEKASVFMMTSFNEGFPFTLTEAQQNGVVPFAFSSFSSVYDIISDGENGYLIPPFDENLYTEKMMQVLSDDELRMRVAKLAVASSEKFSIETIGKRWLDLFESVRN